jgi:hypothetical protein
MWNYYCKQLIKAERMFQIETDGVLNGHSVFPEYVRMNKKISDVLIISADSSQNFRFCKFTREN